MHPAKLTFGYQINTGSDRRLITVPPTITAWEAQPPARPVPPYKNGPHGPFV